jgi:hypothetical protein
MTDLDYLLGIVEYYLFYETSLPEGSILLNVLDEPLRDQYGADISVLTHFNVNDPSFIHFATHLNGILEVNLKHMGSNTIMLQTNIFNAAATGYWRREWGAEWPTQPLNTKIKQCHDGYIYPVPNRILEAIELNVLFMGCWFYPWEAGFTITPVDRSEGLIYSGSITRRDYGGMTALAAGMSRLCAYKNTIEGVEYSVADLIDGTEIYSRELTQVNYLSVPAFSGIRTPRSTDYRKHRLSVVKTIVNENLGLIAILAYMPYGVEQTEVDVYYNNVFQYRINLNTTENKVIIGKLKV